MHSLDPARDLQPGDLRRRLIEHVRDPGPCARPSAGAQPPARSRPFEEEVPERLRREGFRRRAAGARWAATASTSWSRDGRRQVAIECDGDRLKSPERIAEDMARQAVLERVGWRFIQVRATRFFRDRDGAMDAVFGELRRLGVETRPDPATMASGDGSGENLRNKVVRRAWQLMREQDWVSAEPDEKGAEAVPRPSPPPPRCRTPTRSRSSSPRRRPSRTSSSSSSGKTSPRRRSGRTSRHVAPGGFA